jgi:hypothetical protein
MARAEVKAASFAWATIDELTPAIPGRAKQMELAADRQAEAERRHRVEASHGESGEWRRRRRSPSRHGRDERAAPEILIPGYVGPSRRDSLGRDLEP